MTIDADPETVDDPPDDRLPKGASPEDPGDLRVVGIGASAGGLEACRDLVRGLSGDSGSAFILIQHLDPTHESMMVPLLADHTSLKVEQAAEGMPVEPGHLYVIPPGVYLSVSGGMLHLCEPLEPHGARMPFDFLLRSLAKEYGGRAVGVILSGTGADGSLGLRAVKNEGGFVIAQDPEEAGFGGMPGSAIATGEVDLVLCLAEMPRAIVEYRPGAAAEPSAPTPAPIKTDRDHLPEIIDLLRSRTSRDFTLYKPGTLRRRVERRVGMAGAANGDVARYLELLRGDAAELDLLATDLLINVSSFFRDPEVFDRLARDIVPDLVRDRAPGETLRVWVAGCSTGEEAYSIAMLLCEAITAAKSGIRLQLFASDADTGAVAKARDGFYPDTIAADMSPERLSRFFSAENGGYRVSAELRATVVFAVHDVLAEPGFSRIDLISCRNLLIYLAPKAQKKVIALFHFALRHGGVLLLGSAETAGDVPGRFEIISKPERLYRRIGASRPGAAMPVIKDGIATAAAQTAGDRPASRADALADLCRRVLVQSYAPAAVLIDRDHLCLFSMGPTHRYLRPPEGPATHDMLAMLPPALRSRLSAATRRVGPGKDHIVVRGDRPRRDGDGPAFDLDIRPVTFEERELLLVCFVDAPGSGGSRRDGSGAARATAAEKGLEGELEATRRALRDAEQSLERSSEEQRAIGEEASSVKEEFQTTNEELLTSKEELQSLNEELTALNSQLQETLERQRTTSNDLQNILYSTDLATLFLDRDLGIRFFTPATRSLFSFRPSDIGRPLADLASLASDTALPEDARSVLDGGAIVEREIETADGTWCRRMMPYRTGHDEVDGVVITFTDVTERKHVLEALETARRQAELATVAKSRFLAVASHDLRQPLQSLALLHGLIGKAAKGEEVRRLVGRMDLTLGAMSGMLNTLLDINQIEAGTVRAEVETVSIGCLLGRLRDEFAYHAQAKDLALRLVPCSLSVRSDPHLLEQMVRNLISNALKYTKRGKVLLGCRRRGALLSIEVWDTGVGIADGELRAIFEEYHQIGNANRERSRGLGLGLAIVGSLGKLLGHEVRVRSTPDKGSVFAIEAMRAGHVAAVGSDPHGEVVAEDALPRAASILVVEDDPEIRELIELFLQAEGHRVAAAADGAEALAMIADAGFVPDMLLADYNLPDAMDGLQLAHEVRGGVGRELPVMILTGDISTGTLRRIASGNCVHLHKPVSLPDLATRIDALLRAPQSAGHATGPRSADGPDTPVMFVVDDDRHVRDAIRSVLEGDGLAVEDFPDAEAFLDTYRPGRRGCLLIDAYLPGMDGFELLRRLGDAGDRLPAIMITGHGDVPMAVRALKLGASDFIEKPVGGDELLAGIHRALERARDAGKPPAWRDAAALHVQGLTTRQRQVMDLVLAGHPSKNIAADLGISQRTVENHRASIMTKTGCRSVPALVRLALAADWDGADPHAGTETPRQAGAKSFGR